MVIQGKLRLPVDSLNLALTLTTGQNFRWRKLLAKNQWIGVIGNLYVVCLEQQKNVINYEVLNVAHVYKALRLEPKSSDHQVEQDFENHLQNYFSLDVDIVQLYSTWSACDSNFHKVASNFKGIRLLRQDVPENIFSFICSSNNNISRISKMVETLCSRYGKLLHRFEDGQQADIYSFPDISALASSGVEKELRELGFGYRARFIYEAAKRIVDSFNGQPEEWIKHLKSLNYEDAKRELMSLPGIGAKVADCICLMSLQFTEATPVDTHVYQLTARHYLPGLKLTKSLTNKQYNQIGGQKQICHNDESERREEIDTMSDISLNKLYICYQLNPVHNLTFIGDSSYTIFYRVGVYDDEFIYIDSQFCMLKSKVKFMKFLSDALKAKFYVSQEAFGGDLNSKNQWTGMMKLIADKTVDLVFSDFSFSESRNHVVKFSIPVTVNNRFTILYRDVFHRKFFNILSIFEMNVWLVMIAFLLVCFALIYFTSTLHDFSKLFLELFGIFLAIGTVINSKTTTIPRCILILWILGTLIFTFVMRNEILALFSAGKVDKIESVDDIKTRNLKVLVLSDSSQYQYLSKVLDHQQNIVQISWLDFWKVETKARVLSGHYVLVYTEDKIQVMVNVNHEYPWRISTEKSDLRFGFFLYKYDTNKTLETSLNKRIQQMLQFGIYTHLMYNNYREYEVLEKKKSMKGGKGLRMESESSDKFKNLTLLDIVDPFSWLFGGWSISIVVYMLEVVFNRWAERKPI